MKNVLTLVPLLAAGDFTNRSAWWHSLAIMTAFCATASAIYLINDLQEMSRFQAVLRSPRFHPVGHIPVVANVPTEYRSLTIYHNMDDVSPGPPMVDLHLPIIGETVKGTVGK